MTIKGNYIIKYDCQFLWTHDCCLSSLNNWYEFPSLVVCCVFLPYAEKYLWCILLGTLWNQLRLLWPWLHWMTLFLFWLHDRQYCEEGGVDFPFSKSVGILELIDRISWDCALFLSCLNVSLYYFLLIPTIMIYCKKNKATFRGYSFLFLRYQRDKSTEIVETFFSLLSS